VITLKQKFKIGKVTFCIYYIYTSKPNLTSWS